MHHCIKRRYNQSSKEVCLEEEHQMGPAFISWGCELGWGSYLRQGEHRTVISYLKLQA